MSPGAANAVDAEVFISYAQDEDGVRALDLAGRLEAVGISVWIADRAMAGAQNYGPEVVEAIERCRVLVVLCSQASLFSEHVAVEVELAFEAGRPRLPLRLDDTPFPSRIRYWLTGANWVDLRGPAEIWWPEVLRALESVGVAGDLKAASGRDATAETVKPPDRTGEGVPLPLRLAAPPALGFVGRRSDLEALGEALGEVRAGSGVQIVLVGGPPGIGKTTLCSEFARFAHEQGAVVLYGRGEEDLRVPYQPWVEALGDLVAHASSRLLQRLTPHAASLVRLVPSLADRIGAVPSDPSVDPETARYVLFASVRAALEAAGEGGAVVVVLDDLQWADAPSLQLLRSLVSCGAGVRVVVVGTFRDSELEAGHPLTELLAALHREPTVQRLALGGLDDAELLALMEGSAGHALEEPEVKLRDALLAETDGNPFFVVELLRHLAETGALYQEHGRWVTSAALRSQGLPTSVREVIGQRAARLGDEATRVLGLASVIGRDFDLNLLAAVADRDPDAVLEDLEPATAASLIVNVSGEQFSFVHALVEHALYDGLAPARRARLHRRVAQAIEAQTVGEPGARVAELAYHWSQTASPEDLDTAIVYARAAGDQALGGLAPDEAVRWYGQALSMLDRRANDEALRCELMVGLGDGQRQTGIAQYRDTLVDAGQLAQSFGSTDLLARAALATSRLLGTAFGSYAADVVALFEAALAATEGEVSSRRARLLAAIATECWSTQRRDEGFDLANEAIELARVLGDDATLCWVASRTDLARRNPANLTERIRFNREVLDTAQRLGDPVLLWYTAYSCSHSLLEAGQREEADEMLDLARELAERVAEPFIRWTNASMDTGRAMLAGALEDAEAHAQRAFELGTAGGQPESDVVAIYGAHIMGIRSMQGRDAETIEAVAAAQANLPALPAYRATLAAGYARLGRAEEAFETIADDIAADFDLERYPFDLTWSACMVMVSEVVRELELRDAAAVLYPRLTPFGGNLGNADPAILEVGHHALGRLATVLERYDEADTHFRAAAEFHEGLRAQYLLASTRLEWATMLDRRGGNGDVDRVRELAQQAFGAATNGGYGRIEERASALLGGLS
jgi:tetratricopeptide (TPR) repeat protein